MRRLFLILLCVLLLSGNTSMLIQSTAKFEEEEASEVVLISQTVWDGYIDTDNYCFGNSFTMVGDNITKLKVLCSESNDTVKFRIGTSSDLTTCLEEQEVVCTSGWMTVTFTTLTGLTNGGTYYWGVQETGGNAPSFAKAGSNEYAGGTEKYNTNHLNWNLSSSIAHDMTFEILGIQ